MNRAERIHKAAELIAKETARKNALTPQEKAREKALKKINKQVEQEFFEIPIEQLSPHDKARIERIQKTEPRTFARMMKHTQGKVHESVYATKRESERIKKLEQDLQELEESEEEIPEPPTRIPDVPKSLKLHQPPHCPPPTVPDYEEKVQLRNAEINLAKRKSQMIDREMRDQRFNNLQQRRADEAAELGKQVFGQQKAEDLGRRVFGVQNREHADRMSSFFPQQNVNIPLQQEIVQKVYEAPVIKQAKQDIKDDDAIIKRARELGSQVFNTKARDLGQQVFQFQHEKDLGKQVFAKELGKQVFHPEAQALGKQVFQPEARELGKKIFEPELQTRALLNAQRLTTDIKKMNKATALGKKVFQPELHRRALQNAQVIAQDIKKMQKAESLGKKVFHPELQRRALQNAQAIAQDIKKMQKAEALGKKVFHPELQRRALQNAEQLTKDIQKIIKATMLGKQVFKIEEQDDIVCDVITGKCYRKGKEIAAPGPPRCSQSTNRWIQFVCNRAYEQQRPYGQVLRDPQTSKDYKQSKRCGNSDKFVSKRGNSWIEFACEYAFRHKMKYADVLKNEAAKAEYYSIDYV